MILVGLPQEDLAAIGTGFGIGSVSEPTLWQDRRNRRAWNPRHSGYDPEGLRRVIAIAASFVDHRREANCPQTMSVHQEFAITPDIRL